MAQSIPAGMSDTWTRQDEITFQNPMQNTFDADIPRLSGYDLHTGFEIAQFVFEDVSELPQLSKKLAYKAKASNEQKDIIGLIESALILLSAKTVRQLGKVLHVLHIVSIEKSFQAYSRAEFSACLAYEMAIARGDKCPDSCFIRTMLETIGHIEFWITVKEEGVQISEFAQANNQDHESDVQALATQIDMMAELGSILQEVLLNADRQTKLPDLEQYPLLAYEIEANARHHQLHALPKKPLLAAARFCEMSKEEFLGVLQLSNMQAEKLAQEIEIPLSKRSSTSGAAVVGLMPGISQLSVLAPVSPASASNFMSGLELAKQLGDAEDRITLLVQHMHLDLGFDRTLYATLAEDRSQFDIKYVLGQNGKQLRRAFDFNLSDSNYRIFNYVMNIFKNPLWIDPEEDEYFASLVGPKIRQLSLNADFVLAPIGLMQQPMGIVYADCSQQGTRMDYTKFKNFCKCVMQINDCIAKLD